MISIFVWVYFLIGDPMNGEQGTPYVQIETSQYLHDTARLRDAIEKRTHDWYEESYPGHPVCDGGWCRQEVKVWQA